MKKKKNNNPFIYRATQWAFPRLERWMPFLAHRIFILAFNIPATYRVPEKEEEIANTADKFIITVDGKKIQLYSWGDKNLPIVLLVHGWAGRATQFRKFINPLQEAGYRVMAFDGPAHGKSEGVKTSLPGFENVLKKVIEHIGDPIAVITHSFGGAVALYAAANGLQINRLINIATPYVEDEILKSYLVVLNGSWQSAERFKEYVIEESGKPFSEFTGLYSLQHLSHLLNLLIVHDEDDSEMLYLHAEAAAKVYPSAKLLTTKGLGHTRILKDDGVIGECVKFIKAG